MNICQKLAAIIIIGLFCHFRVLAQDAHFTLVDPPKEQPWTGVFVVTQDAQGYLWLCANEGLYKYDGRRYTVYQHDQSNPNTIGSNQIASFFADRDGIIWLGTVGKGLDKFDQVTGKVTHYRHDPVNARSLIGDTVTAIIRDRDGILWVGTTYGLDKFDPETGSFTHFVHNDKDPSSLSCNLIGKIYEDREGTVWIGTGSAFPKDADKNAGGLNKLNKKNWKFTVYRHDPDDNNSLIDNRIGAIFEDSKGVFWVGTAGDGLHTMDREKGTFQRHLYDAAHPGNLSRPPLKNDVYFSDDHINFINEDISGKIWIGTFSNGINVYDPLTNKTVWYGTDPKSDVKIKCNSFVTSFRSRDGVLWIASFQDVQVYKVIPYNNQLPHTNAGKYVMAFAEGADSTFWMTTKKGLIHKKRDNTLETFKIDELPPGIKASTTPPWVNFLYFIEKDDENKFWLSNWQGLYKFDPLNKSFKAYYHQDGNPDGLISNGIMFIKKDGPGKLWIGTLQGLQLMDTKTGTFRNFVNNPGDSISISYNLIQSIAIDQNGTVWISTDNGINKLDKITMRFKHYMMNVITRHLLFDKQGDLWAGTDQGLYKYDKNTDNFINFGGHRTQIFWISEDEDGNLWMHTNYGIVKVNVKTQETNVYGKKQGVVNDLFFGYTLRNGKLLAGDSTGFFEFSPDKVLHNTPAPIVVINGFYLADELVRPSKDGVLSKPVYNTNEIDLSHNQTTFSLAFTIVDFMGEAGDNQIFYKLENYDRKWQAENLDEIANYYNVPPGKYIFRVKCINLNGLVTQKQLTIVISQAWYKTWWAYVIFVVAIGAGIWAVIYYRSVQLLKTNRVLENKIHVRTQEVMQQKEEIEVQRDSLGKALNELKVAQRQLVQSEKMASMGELTAGIAHEIQNPLNFVNNFSEVSIELMAEMNQELDNGDTAAVKAIAADVSQNLEKISHHGKRADNIVKGMLEHSRTSKGQKEPVKINALANEFLKMVYHGLREKDKSFHAELVTNFDSHLPDVTAIQAGIVRVLLNIFNNAFYAVQQKQKVAGPDYKPAVEVSTSVKKGVVEIKVTDNGTGIPDAIKDKIMQPFFTTKPTGEGTGLGLSLSYDIVVNGHGGQLKMDSKLDSYTTFTVLLPLMQ